MEGNWVRKSNWEEIMERNEKKLNSKTMTESSNKEYDTQVAFKEAVENLRKAYQAK